MLSQIGDIAGGGNFILASHRRPGRSERGSTLGALSLFLSPSHIQVETHTIIHFMFLSGTHLQYTLTHVLGQKTKQEMRAGKKEQRNKRSKGGAL